MDGGAWWVAVHGIVKSRTRLSDFPFTFHFHALEKEMATHSSVLAWRIPGTGEPGGLPSMGSHRVQHDWSDLAAAAAGVLECQRQLSGVSDPRDPAGWVGVSHKKKGVLSVQGGEGNLPDSECEDVQVNTQEGDEYEIRQRMDWWGQWKGFRMDTALWGAVRAGLDRGAGTHRASPMDAGCI